MKTKVRIDLDKKQLKSILKSLQFYTEVYGYDDEYLRHILQVFTNLVESEELK